jgi:hypothetical protein
MRALLIRTEKGLRGATPEDHAAWTKFRRKIETLKPGKWLRLEFSSPRNGKHHAKFFALLHLIAENSETWDTPEKALIAVKLCVGHFEPCVHPETGELIQVPKSIAFESMEQEAFEAFYSRAIDAVLKSILPQFNRETADRLLDMIVEGWVA